MLDCYRDKDFMERFCRNLKEHATRIINYEKKEMIPLTDKQDKPYEKQKVCYICKKEFSTDGDNKRYQKLRDHCHYTGKYRGAAHDIFNLRYKKPKEIPLVFHNSSTTYDYRFIIKQLAIEFNGQLEGLGENTEKHINFSLPIKKELDNSKTIMYKWKFMIALDLCQPHCQV